jgi:flagellar basal-body rod protein FlgC
MSIFAQENNIYQQYLNINNIPIIIGSDENNCYIDDSIITKDFFKFIDFINLKIEIIIDNITNEKTTRINNGGPFKRKYIRIVNGEITIAEDISQPRLIYDPAHPDSIKDGPRKGYVEFPNVDIVIEMVDLIMASRILEIISLKGLERHIINKDEYEQLMKRLEILDNEIMDIYKK